MGLFLPLYGEVIFGRLLGTLLMYPLLSLELFDERTCERKVTIFLFILSPFHSLVLWKTKLQSRKTEHRALENVIKAEHPESSQKTLIRFIPVFNVRGP